MIRFYYTFNPLRNCDCMMVCNDDEFSFGAVFSQEEYVEQFRAALKAIQ